MNNIKENSEEINNEDFEEGDIEGDIEGGILLKLGDIILIIDPSNEILNNNIFLIDYIDKSKAALINSETFEKTILQISPDGLIGDGNINSINVLSSNPEKGYARQNDLLPGTWINIYFGGEIPTIITGKITNLEEDMIEIKTTDNDIIYINFAYKGIPEDLPIETFEIRPAIIEKEGEEEQGLEEREEEEQGLEEREEGEEGLEEDLEDVIENKKLEEVSKNVVKEKIKKMIFDINDIQFGEVVNVEEYIHIDKDKNRYGIESQTNDILEEMLSTLPNYKRTSNVLNSIHIMITRFLQLREISSTFDQNKNISGIIKRTANDKPLAEYLSEFKNNLYWIMMVAKNVKKIYPNSQLLENNRYDDYETLNSTDDLEEMALLYVTNQLNRNTKSKYSSFTYKSFEKFMSPSYSVNIDVTNNVFAEPNSIIIEGNVESNINVIIDNLGDLYSTVVDNSKITNRRFVIQKYNLALEKLHVDSFKGKHMISRRVKVAPNDAISINSIITLPEPTIRFSQVNLPGSNLLIKANLNLHFLNYWQLLKQKTNLTKITVDGLENEIKYTDSNFVDNIKQYLLNLTEYKKPDNISNLDIYKIFLKTIIPKIRVLFSLVKKYIKGRLSLVDVVNYLEPFMIYPIDLTYMQYREINSFIYEKIKEYNTQFKEYNMLFSSLKYIKNSKGQLQTKNQYTFSNPLFSLLETTTIVKFSNNLIMDTYGYDNPNSMTISGSEFLKNIMVADYGNLFNTVVSFNNLALMFPKNLSNVFDNDKERMQKIIEKDKEYDKCSSYIITKKYYSKESLLSDNEKQIYFDKEFDTTNYDLIEEKYKKQRDQLSTEEFILYLSDEFRTKSNMNEESAEYMANTLVNQAKRVREGDYALLILTNGGESSENDPRADQMEYYVRNNDVWVLDNEMDKQMFIKQDDVLCNIDYSCMYNTSLKTQETIDNKCISTEVSKDKIIQNTLKGIIDQFDEKYNISQAELNTQITNKIIYYYNLFERLSEIKEKKHLKYNNIYYNLGLSIKDEINDRKISPYTKLRDLIIGQNDFIKRQNDIVRFVALYCYQGNSLTPNINDGDMENEWWLYCNETNTKLLPKFHHILASTFINNNNKYDDVLNELKRQIGKKSDDGDAWVDENSGEVICYIDFDVSEEYKEGFVDTSRSIIEKDSGEVILEKQQEKQQEKQKAKRLSPEGEIVSNIVSILSINMGINIEQSREFIIRVVTELMNDTNIIEKEPAYRKREEDAAKRGKKIPSYGTVYASAILYLTLGLYLVGIQTSIPSIKTRKTAPGCVRSFSGFPFEGEGDNSSLNYLACVALKSRDPTTIPWNVLPKNEERIVTLIKSFIIRYILPYGEVEEKIKEKTEYLLVNTEDFIPEEHDLSKWLNFLPPLKIFKVTNLQNISEGFSDELKDDLYLGKHKQIEKLLIIDSKIIAFSFAIQESIQKLVEKKTLLLKSGGQIFMDNACCNETGNTGVTSLQYFINEDKNIENYNNIVISLTSLVRDIKILTDSVMMLSETNSKRIFPAVSNDFNEEIIYRAFIILCKFQSSMPLTEEISAICLDKPDYLRKMDTIQEKILKLKRDNRNYTKADFLRLFQLVSRNNIIKLSSSTKNITCIDNFKKIIVQLDYENNENVSKSFRQHLEKLVETYDVLIEEDTKEMRKLKDYLQTSITKMKNELLEFIRSKSEIGPNELKNMTKFIKEISIWNFDKNTINNKNDSKISDDGLYNYINFIKSYIELFVVVFPSMIINKNIQLIEPPKYWGLALDHSNDIREMVSDFYRPIEKFYGDPIIKNVLNEIMIKSKGTYLLSQNTPILTTIKIGDKEVYNVFDKRIITLLYEYYFLSVLTDYMNLTSEPTMVSRMLINPKISETDTFSADFLVEQELRFAEFEKEFIEGDVMKLNKNVAKLLVSYLKIMMKSKKTINVSYEDIQDNVFKLKEAEKYDFTDKLRDMTDEARAVDTILKHHKLGALYSLGMSKGIKEYDPEHFEHDKKIAENVSRLQNKLKRTKGALDNIDLDDAIDEMVTDQEIDMDLAMDMNPSDDYDDGDPWGEETENYGDYD
jgi:hypothetical protein